MAGLRAEAAVELITLRQAADDPKQTNSDHADFG